MSSIDQLRRTLEEHANAVHDSSAVGRAVAAKAQARRDRRQRVAAVAMAAAVAVVASVTIAVWPKSSGPVPADRVINGHEAPATMKSLGYTYRFVRGVEAPDGAPARLALARSATPRLVSWAVDDDVPVLVTDFSGDFQTDRPSEFDDFVLVPPGNDAAFRVSGRRPVLAVYELAGLAPGYTVDGVTYREEVAGATLLGAAISRPGEDELSFDVEPTDGPVSARFFCSGGRRGTTLHLQLGGEREVTSIGCEDDSFDPAGQGSLGLPAAAAPREQTTGRVWVTEQDGRRVSADGLRFGVGVYDEAPPGARTAAGDVPALQEARGHTWRLSAIVESSPGRRSLQIEHPDGEPTLVHFFVAHAGGARVRTLVDGRPGTVYTGGVSSGSVTGWMRPSATTYGVRLAPTAGPETALALAAYERID